MAQLQQTHKNQEKKSPGTKIWASGQHQADRRDALLLKHSQRDMKPRGGQNKTVSHTGWQTCRWNQGVKNNSTCVLHVLELCFFIIPNVSSNVQTREIHKLTQGDDVFHLVTSSCSFRRESEWGEVREGDKTTWRKTLKHHLVLNQIRFSTAVTV